MRLPGIPRRACVLAVLPAVLPPRGAAAQSAHIPATGPEHPGTAVLDGAMRAVMARHGIPGGALAVARDGRLVVSRGYGMADAATGRPVRPDTPFRLASLTKPIAAIAVLALAEREEVALNAPVGPILRGALDPAPTGPMAAPVTLRHLLRHVAGWGPLDRPAGGGMDPAALAEYRRRLGRDLLTQADRVAAAWAEPPRHAPGTRFAYSTFGYCTLGLAAEAATGRPMAALWRETVFAPLGLPGPWLAAAEWAGETPAPGEARYHDPPGTAPVEVATPAGRRRLSAADAYWGPLTGDACVTGGRLVASAPDYLRILLGAGGRRGPALLPPRAQALLFADGAELEVGPNVRFTHGLFARRAEDGQTAWWHTGGMPGTATYYARHGRLDVAVLLNLWPPGGGFHDELARAIWRALEAVRDWPERDLFAAPR